jgi:3-deoxy-D-manno-octulosonic-acid transferase
MSSLSKPWGVLGSVWSEDLELWKKFLRPMPEKLGGSVLLVPHRIDSEHLVQLEQILTEAQIPYVKTQDYGSAKQFQAELKSRPELRCVLVNEMGFLSELYSVADWAYVGGGMGRGGVHSTIEPAIHGIPICCGSHRAHQFVEIAELQASGQLTIVKSVEDVRSWIQKMKSSSEQERWKAEAQKRLGATDRIISALQSVGEF